MKPAAFGANLAARELVNHGRHDLDDARDQAAVRPVVVGTVMGLTGGGEAEDLGGLRGRGHGEDFWRDWKGLVEVGDLEGVANLLNDPEHTTTLQGGLCTRA